MVTKVYGERFGGKSIFWCIFSSENPACVRENILVFGAALARPLLGGIRRENGVAAPLGLSRSVHRKFSGRSLKSDLSISRSRAQSPPQDPRLLRTLSKGLAHTLRRRKPRWQCVVAKSISIGVDLHKMRPMCPHENQLSISGVETRFSPAHHLEHGRA